MTDDEISEQVGSVTGLFQMKPKAFSGLPSTWKPAEQYHPTTIDVDGLTDIQRYVLEDAFSGSTVCGQVAHLVDDPDPKERLIYANAKRSMHIIGRKFRECGLQGDFIPDF